MAHDIQSETSASLGRVRSRRQAKPAGQDVLAQPDGEQPAEDAEDPPGQRFALAARDPWLPSSVLKISTARDGVMVRALMAEMIVETAIVTANWRKNWPRDRRPGSSTG